MSANDELMNARCLVMNFAYLLSDWMKVLWYDLGVSLNIVAFNELNLLLVEMTHEANRCIFPKQDRLKARVPTIGCLLMGDGWFL
jgi:hypothetical protein